MDGGEEAGMGSLYVRLLEARRLALDTQELRRRLIATLEELFEEASRALDDPEYIRLAGYIAQVINSLTKAYDEYEFEGGLRELQELIEEAKRQLEEGSPQDTAEA